jgi:imidazole glycerol-phosphate synthase subunit HisH
LTVAIVDTGIGNFGSIANVLLRAGGEPLLASNASALARASHIVLPGVGSFDAAISVLDQKGLRQVLSRRVLDEGIPALGICLGMQVLGMSSEEGKLAGLGWLPGRSIRFRPPAGRKEFRVPHIGWNGIFARQNSPLLDGLGQDACFYYVHSFHYAEGVDGDTLAMTDYGYPFPAIIRRNSIVGVQFHPERSGVAGLAFVANFLRMKPGD